MTQPLHAALAAGAHSLGLNLSEVQIGQLLDFLALLQKWNRVYNLTAVREPGDMLTHHLLDSLAAVPALQRQLAVQAQAGQGAGGVCHLHACTRRAVCRHGGQESGLCAAGGGQLASAQLARGARTR